MPAPTKFGEFCARVRELDILMTRSFSRYIQLYRKVNF